MRNRYLDLLRAAAIARVIVYHLFGWPWLSILLPAMGVMFALAGSLTAASLDKRPAGKVITSRLRRLLPPLWLLGVIAVPAMLYAGWRQEEDPTTPFSVARLALWILPIGDPPGSDKGVDLWEPLWYIRAYLWFVVLSPGMYWLYRKIRWGAVALPLVLIALLDWSGFTLPDLADAAMWDFVTFGACWILGFAHHDGRLARVRPWIVLTGAAVLGAAALSWLRGHQGEDAWDLNDVSESQALWSVAFVLLALRWQPPMGWLARVKPLDKAVTFLNARAVTVYLWHNIAIAAIWPLLTLLALDDLGHLDDPVDLATALLLTLMAVVSFGWVEDLAAKRQPQFWPTGPSTRPAPAVPGSSAPDFSIPGSSAPGFPASGSSGPGSSVAGSSAAGSSAAGSPAPQTLVMPRQAQPHAGPREPSVPEGWGKPPAVVSPTAALPIIGAAPSSSPPTVPTPAVDPWAEEPPVAWFGADSDRKP